MPKTSIVTRWSTLLPLEIQILAVAVRLHRGQEPSFHGFQLAQDLADARGAKRLTAHGTLYKALGRLHAAGLLSSAWEDPDVAVATGTPRRRLYQVTAAGAAALAAADAERVPAAEGIAHMEAS